VLVAVRLVRLGCGLDYDQLQDLAEQHRALRQMMGLGDWDEDTSFNWRRIRDNVCLLRPETIEAISQQVVAAGHALAPDAAKEVRADSFVVGTNIHWPSEGTLIRDGLRKIIELCVLLATRYGQGGWRQSDHLLKKVHRLSRRIERLAARKRPGYQEHLKEAYRHLLRFSGQVLSRAEELITDIEQQGTADMSTLACVADLQVFMERTEQVRGTARRRVMHGESVPNEEKLFSIFEPHTQLYKRGKAGEPIQFGRLVLIYEDAAGFVIHHHVLPREAQDKDVAVEQTRIAQEKMGGRIEQMSFDRGFHTPQNQIALAEIVAHPCLPKPGVKQAAQQAAKASVEFREARQRHPGVESAIGALQRGNDLERCRDRSEVGFHRYVALGILGRNLHALGKLLIAQAAPDSLVAHSDRSRAA
jgi:hypothetical protein